MAKGESGTSESRGTANCRHGGGVAARTPKGMTLSYEFLSESISERSASVLDDGAGHWCQPCRAKRPFTGCSAATGARQSDHAGAVRKNLGVNEAARGPGARGRNRQQRRFIQAALQGSGRI